MKRQCQKYEVPNKAPEAVAEGPDKVRQTSTIKLDGSKSSDPDGNLPLTYSWRLVDIPTGSQASLDDPSKVDPSFTVDKAGTFVAELVVTDKKGSKSKPARVSISVYGEEENEAPLANAGPDQVTGVGMKVELDGSGSNDPEGDPLTYAWAFKTKPEGSAAKLDDETAKKPTFSPDKPGRYILELVVTDGLESSSPDTVTVEAMVDFDLEPKLSKVSPNEGYASTVVEAELSGQSFSENAAVLFDGSALSADKVKFVNDTTLTVTLELTQSPGDYEIVVRNPNRKESAAVKFTVKELPPPVLTKLTPNTGISGAKYDIKVTGSGFIKGDSESNSTVVLFQLVPMITTVISDTELTFKLDLSRTLPGEYKVQLRNPGNRSSKTLMLTVLPEADAPVLRVLNPPRGVVGTKLAFSVHGTGFIQGAQIIFNGKALPSKRIRRDEIQADPELDLTNIPEGKYKVWVRNPDGKESAKLDFEVEGKDPTPQLDRILPFFVYLNDVTTLNIYGQRFRANANGGGMKLFLGNNEISGKAVQFRSSSYLVVTVDTTQGSWKAGDYQAYVVNANGKKSNTFKLTVTYRIPTISNITPGGWNTKCDTDVEVYGSNFTNTVQLKFGSTTYTTTSSTNKLTRVDDKNLKFKLKSSGLSATTYNVVVENGPNAKSQPFSFRVVSGSSIPKPEIRELRPAAGQADTKVSVLMYYTSSSKRFELGSVVTLNGKVQKTTCSGTSYCYNLTAELDLTGVKPGQHQLRVVNPCNNVSDPATFLVTEAPDPHIAQIAPPYASVGDQKIVAIRGLNFSKRAKLLWGGKEIQATVKSDKEIVTNKLDFTNATAGTEIDVQVDNGNNKKSAVVKFPILAKNAPLVITSVSTHEFERGKVHNGIVITGQGFTKTSEVYFNGDKVTTKFGNQFQLTADGLDFQTLKVGTYYIWVKDGTKQSNKYAVLAKPFPPPVIDRTRPTTIFEGNGSTRVYLYGREFCQLASKNSCKQQPLVKVVGPNKQDLSSRYTITRVYISSSSGWRYAYVYGNFNSQGLKPGVYLFYFKLPTGELSNPAPITIKAIPPPSIDRIRPTSIYAGQSVSSFYIYALHFCPTNGSRCSKNPIVHIYDDQNKDHGSKYNITYTYVSSSGTYAYMRGSFDASSLKAGSYTIVVEHPDTKKKSSPFNLVLGKLPDPQVRYSSPYYIYQGLQRSYYLYGNYFGSGAFLRSGLKTYPLTGTSSTSRQFIYDAKNAKEGQFTFVVQNPNGASSDPYTMTIVKKGGSPVITRINPQPMLPGRSYTLYVYGLNWTTSRTPTMLLDGKTFSYSSRYCYPTSSNPYCRFYSFKTTGLKPGKHTMQYVSGTNKSPLYPFYVAKPPAPSVSSISPSSASHGTVVSQITISGNDFQSGAFVRIGLKTYPLSYSSTSRLYLRGFDTKKFKKGDKLKMVVVNPDNQTSNFVTFTIN